MPPKFKNAVICFSGTFDVPTAQLQKWTEANGGTYTRKLSPSTTHLVTSKANWRNRVPEVVSALEDSKIKIVDYEWFDDRLRLSGRVVESKYLWQNIDAERVKQQAKEERAAEREKKREAKEKERKKKEGERIDYAAAFMQHTSVVAKVSDDEEEEETDGDGDEVAAAAGREGLAKQFARGVKQAKEDLMSENHHVYMDVTGFAYDIVLTKASVELSRLDRARITLYEHNASPQNYSLVVKLAEKTPLSYDTPVIVSNTNFATAFKHLRENFALLTGVDWDKRIKKFSSAAVLAPLPRANIIVTSPGPSAAVGKLAKVTKVAKKGAANEDEVSSEEAKKKRLEAAFAAQKYRYRVPDEGQPRGAMPDGSHYFKHQDKKSVYDLFGKSADRGEEKIAKREALKEEARRLRIKRQQQQQGNKAVEVVLIESDDEEEEDEGEEEEDDEDDDNEDEDEEMEHDGYVAVNAPATDVEMSTIELDNDAATGVQQQDSSMLDAPTTQT